MSFSKVTLTPFLSPLPPTTPDKCVVLPDSGRCKLAVRQRFVGRSDPGVAALDQESPGSSPGGAIKAAAKCCGFLIATPVSSPLAALRGRAQEGQLEARCDDESCRASCVFGACNRFTSIHAPGAAWIEGPGYPKYRRERPHFDRKCASCETAVL